MTLSLKDKITAALFEVGFVDPGLVTGTSDSPEVLLGPRGVPDAVCWTAFFICGADCSCWPCWKKDMHCDHDPKDHPRPRLSV